MRQSEYLSPVHDTSLKLQCTHHHVIEVTQRTPDVKNSNAWKKDFFFSFSKSKDGRTNYVILMLKIQRHGKRIFFFSFSKSKDGRTNYPLQYLQHKRCWG